MAISRLSDGSLQDGFPKFDSIWDGISAVGSMEPISAITLTAAQSSVEFNNIPSTYSHLQLRGIARDSSTSGSLRMYINNDANNRYSRHVLYGDGTSALASSSNGDAIGAVGDIATSSYTASVFGVFIIDILDYTSTNKTKTVRSLSGVDNNGSGYIELRSFGYYDPALSAVTSLQIYLPSSTFTANSSFSLYGIK